ncbi:MAG: substrate-binding domain-containing protein [Firmicutes bacterium]|nr:substrate-binding domain-containing protein [Bacteroidales bacterium]MCM1205790.1 substrate-binding domain-containing protein [Bacillota bacterium]MCM1509967.1 substrate-binding domain-containing protein [Clostridium sp.]
MVAFFAIVLASCKNKSSNGRTDTYASGEMTVMCDESFSPIINEEIKVFHATYPDATVTPEYTNEIDAFNALMEQKVHLIITARNYSEKQLEFFKTNGLQPRYFPLGYDGLAFIINKENVDSCISVNDIKRILSGQVRNWNEVNKGSKLGEIDVVFDNAKSAAVHWAVDSILDGKPINSPNITAVNTSAEVINYVEKTKNAIGIIGSNWLNDKRDTTNVTFNKNINVMSVCQVEGAKADEMNSWKPYQLYLLDGRYPFARTVYALLVDPYHGLPVGFANFMQSPIGQKIVLKSALLPYRGDLQWRKVQTD